MLDSWRALLYYCVDSFNSGRKRDRAACALPCTMSLTCFTCPFGWLIGRIVFCPHDQFCVLSRNHLVCFQFWLMLGRRPPVSVCSNGQYPQEPEPRMKPACLLLTYKHCNTLDLMEFDAVKTNHSFHPTERTLELPALNGVLALQLFWDAKL